jgi:hypothetical protein
MRLARYGSGSTKKPNTLIEDDCYWKAVCAQSHLEKGFC